MASSSSFPATSSSSSDSSRVPPPPAVAECGGEEEGRLVVVGILGAPPSPSSEQAKKKKKKRRSNVVVGADRAEGAATAACRRRKKKTTTKDGGARRKTTKRTGASGSRTSSRPTRPNASDSLPIPGWAISALFLFVGSMLAGTALFLHRLDFPDERRAGVVVVVGPSSVVADRGADVVGGAEEEAGGPRPPGGGGLRGTAGFVGRNSTSVVAGGGTGPSSSSPSPPSLIHIVNTRFMQDQGHLVHLATARLKLFETFCLPTMAGQKTERGFLWIIKTDPELHETVRNWMVELLSPYPHFFLVGSNVNYRVGHGEGAWRGGAEGRDVLYGRSTTIFSGDVELLRRAHEEEERSVVLETRLDADDGLVHGYLEYVQKTAMERFQGGANKTETPPKWLYWCSRRHVRWYADPSTPEGNVTAAQHSNLCVSVGITVGFGPDVPESDVPDYQHDKLLKSIRREGGCGYQNKTRCVKMVESFPMAAIRSRSPTSAGMMNVRIDPREAMPKWTEPLWRLLAAKFGISRRMAAETNQYIQKHLREVALDNLKGQCTDGHSCKNSSQVLLQRMAQIGPGTANEGVAAKRALP